MIVLGWTTITISGSLKQLNTYHEDWTTFFIEERLEPQLKLAERQGKVNTSHRQQFEALYPRLSSIFPKGSPSLIHGDLWSGNFMTGPDGYACIIDPAAYHHREAELAFTDLFGGYDRSFYAAYEEAYPLVTGYTRRKDIYNLYPLMVHVNLFGGSYLASVESILRTFVELIRVFEP